MNLEASFILCQCSGTKSNQLVKCLGWPCSPFWCPANGHPPNFCGAVWHLLNDSCLDVVGFLFGAGAGFFFAAALAASEVSFKLNLPLDMENMISTPQHPKQATFETSPSHTVAPALFLVTLGVVPYHHVFQHVQMKLGEILQSSREFRVFFEASLKAFAVSKTQRRKYRKSTLDGLVPNKQISQTKLNVYMIDSYWFCDSISMRKIERKTTEMAGWWKNGVETCNMLIASDGPHWYWWWRAKIKKKEQIGKEFQDTLRRWS